MKNIIIKGAREHNLKNINLTLPRDKFIVITGLSGSGKSTLAFDTLYAEGNRRYVESLSAYARQFLGKMNKPDVDSIEGLSPAISIEQKSTSKNPRSTVGTVTEIYDYLRLLFARVGIPHCPNHSIEIQAQSPERVAQRISEDYNGEVIILAPIVAQKKGTYEQLIKDLNKDGYSRARVDGEIQRTDKPVNLDRYVKHDIEIVIDRFNISDLTRLTEATEQALIKGDGLIMAIDDNGKINMYSARMSCPKCEIVFEELQPRMFSFNSPFGACEECNGLGVKIEFSPALILPDKSWSIMDGAIAIYGKVDITWRGQQIQIVGKKFGFDLFTPLNKFTKKQLNILLYGSDKPLSGRWSTGAKMNMEGGWEGVIPQSERLYKHTESDWRRREFEKYMVSSNCPACKGKRLKDKVLAVKVNDKNIMEVTDFSIEEAVTFFKDLKLSKRQKKIADLILKEIKSRLSFLSNVGLNYLTLSRKAGTLSGGESQRIRLATQIGANLMGVLYILDEPSIGLHQKDNQKLINTLHQLRDKGNTLIVVEHDEDTIRGADHVVDIGPGAGIHGGRIVAQGTVEQIQNNKKSLTGLYLAGKNKILVPENRRESKNLLTIKGAREHNLKNIDVDIPIGVLTCVTGVSGSGKSTLITDILYKSVMQKLHGSRDKPGEHDKIIFDEKNVDKIIVIDQSPIGKTSRSNPVTYIKAFDDIRNLFAATKEANLRGYKIGRFSFNIPGGRCEKCRGDGTIKIEMNFLPDVYIECEDCKGKRYNKETLQVLYKGKSIADVLDMSVEEALNFFKAIPNIYRKINTLHKVGLDYIKVGQSSTTLSGGEAQRIKITRELAKRGTGSTLYLLDEPTTGLHFHDINRLLGVLNSLVDKGNTVVVVEHNLDVIKCADYIIDLGPGGGDYGGEVIACGTPEEIVKVKKSFTGKFLSKMLKSN